jgi:hypothetical protein
MKHYQLISSSFEGFVDIYFNENGLLTEFSTKGATLSESQQLWILKHMPRELAELQQLIGSSTTAKLVEIKNEISFEMFWDRYDDKQLSSKKRTESKWNKLSQAERQKAYNYIGNYFASIPSGTRKKYAETYLNAELWNN